METTTGSSRLAFRMSHAQQRELETVAKAIAVPHRREVTLSDAIRAAISIAAQAVQGREQAEAHR